ncbi:scavenger receptor cysteine-rich domain-containing group B protein-like [Pseudorasbora parva]|uniref:scavenger receptor cysteine-rich domain-containing group B protein-like n=1 Tax=Pseudorasbora parva TaxID=51549 RepID=UPI00351F499E
MNGPVAGLVKGRELQSNSDASKVEVEYWFGLSPACEELVEVLTRAVARLNIDWPTERYEAGRKRTSKLDERFLPSHASEPQRRGLPFLHDLHTEVARSWKRLASYRVFSPQTSVCSNIAGLKQYGYGAMPKVEETLASHLSPSSALSLKAPSLPTSPVFALVGNAYSAAGQAAACLHTMAIVQAYKADLLRDMDSSDVVGGDIITELRSSADLALRATKETARSTLSATASQPEVKAIKLVNGSNLCSGRVEVLHNGIWGTVCDDHWDSADAAVVCQELGCGSVIEAKSNAYFGQGSGQIWLDNVQCSGSESTLVNCSSNAWGSHDCGHHEDAGVVCQAVKLVNGSNRCSGRVEVLHNGIWGTVCDDQWDSADAAVVCRELGCTSIIEAKSNAYFGQGSGQIWLDDVQCSGSESTLANCSSNAWGSHDCGHGEDAGVICQAVKLVNGSNLCSGRVEILHNGIWGTVCDDQWDSADAAVVCQELGCGSVIEAKSNAYFGQGSGQIWLDNVQCSGSESTLANCSSNAWGSHDCGHGEDAGVICQAVKLVNGPNLCSGRVEILHNGIWGTVCDDQWDSADAAVVCQELGCESVKEAKSNAYFGQGSGQIWLDNVQCSGSESILVNCSSNAWGSHDCGHGEDAGVVCQGKARKK